MLVRRKSCRSRRYDENDSKKRKKERREVSVRVPDPEREE